MPLPPCAEGVHVTDTHYPTAIRYNVQSGNACPQQDWPTGGYISIVCLLSHSILSLFALALRASC